jgi:hypothetical protein
MQFAYLEWDLDTSGQKVGAPRTIRERIDPSTNGGMTDPMLLRDSIFDASGVFVRTDSLLVAADSGSVYSAGWLGTLLSSVGDASLMVGGTRWSRIVDIQSTGGWTVDSILLPSGSNGVASAGRTTRTSFALGTSSMRAYQTPMQFDFAGGAVTGTLHGSIHVMDWPPAIAVSSIYGAIVVNGTAHPIVGKRRELQSWSWRTVG